MLLFLIFDIMELIKLNLVTKNGTYLYVPIVKIENRYFWCESILFKKVTKIKDINIEDLKTRREIPEQFYQANGIKI